MPGEARLYDPIAVVVRPIPIHGGTGQNPYDEESDLLVVNVDGSAPWGPRHTVVVGDDVICKVNTERVLLRFELLCPRSCWQIAPSMHVPEATYGGCLQFASSVLERNTIHTPPVCVLTDPQQSYADIRFSDHAVGETWIALSAQCLASVIADRLTGFFVCIASARAALWPCLVEKTITPLRCYSGRSSMAIDVSDIDLRSQ